MATAGPHLVFAGHTDVVPPGDEERWRHPPFAGDIADDVLFGRGAVDMKGAIACELAAVVGPLAANRGQPEGSVSVLLTGEEEGGAGIGTMEPVSWGDDP